MSRKRILVAAAAVIGLGAYAMSRSSEESEDPDASPSFATEDLRTAIFAGGCFWCMEASFEKVPGVIEVESGYTGGFEENPTYDKVTDTSHQEAVRVTYDSSRLTYDDLLEVFWRSIDPTDGGGQFADRGRSYVSAIFVSNDEQRAAAERSKKALEDSERFDKPIVTPVRDAGKFYAAEEDHQDYYKTHPWKYKYYRSGSGRDRFIAAKWGNDRQYVPRGRGMRQDADTDGRNWRISRKPSDDELKAGLTPLQYRVTQQEATERPFKNAYWDLTEAGIYVDIVSGEPLFSSRDKFKSGTGWPSFTRPLADANIVAKAASSLFWGGTEVRSKHGDSHLGHLFGDGPHPTGLRYCINSAALRFIPADKLEAEGYGEFRFDAEP